MSGHQDVLGAMGKVNAMLQRRNDVSINLSKAVIDYAKHERGVFTAVTQLRTFLAEYPLNDPESKQLLKKFEQPKTATPKKAADKAAGKSGDAVINLDPSSTLGHLLAVAEQYPDLKLSATFQTLMSALIEIEKDISAERIKYNDIVNIYTTNINRFPVNIFAKIFKFKEMPYFEAAEEAKKLKPIKY